MTQTDAKTDSEAFRIMGRRNRLPSAQRKFFDRIFHSRGGNVLDFTIPTMEEWFEEKFDIEIFQERFQIEGASKGKTLRGFVAVAEPRLVARVLRALWHYRCSPDRNSCLQTYTETDPNEEARLKAWLDQFISELDNAPSLNLEDALPDFSHDTTLSKLRASIAADLGAEKPMLRSTAFIPTALSASGRYFVHVEKTSTPRRRSTRYSAPMARLYAMKAESVRSFSRCSVFNTNSSKALMTRVTNARLRMTMSCLRSPRLGSSSTACSPRSPS